MRRFVLATLAAVLVVLPLSAAPAFPVTVAPKYGSTTLTQAPKRVVSLGMTDQDPLIALGVVPVAVFPWAKPLIGTSPVPKVLTFELDFEAIAALNPDLIMGLSSALTKEEYDTLSKIAPTVAQPGDVVDWAVSWQAATRTVGAVLGKPTDAEGFTVADLVRRGRFPHRGPWEPLGPEDEAAVARALAVCSSTNPPPSSTPSTRPRSSTWCRN